VRAIYEQLEFFPAPTIVDRLDLALAGKRSRVRAMYAVRLGHEQRVHRVFDDRHGVYCEEHGRGCEAAARVRAMGGDRATPARAANESQRQASA
jgi:hypothetical protein